MYCTTKCQEIIYYYLKNNNYSYPEAGERWFYVKSFVGTLVVCKVFV